MQEKSIINTYDDTLEKKVTKLFTDNMNEIRFISFSSVSDTDFCVFWYEHGEPVTSWFFESILEDDITYFTLSVGYIFSKIFHDIKTDFLSERTYIETIWILMRMIISLDHIIDFRLSEPGIVWIYREESPTESCTDLIDMIYDRVCYRDTVYLDRTWALNWVWLDDIPDFPSIYREIEIRDAVRLNRFDHIGTIIDGREWERDYFPRDKEVIFGK